MKNKIITKEAFEKKQIHRQYIRLDAVAFFSKKLFKQLTEDLQSNFDFFKL